MMTMTMTCRVCDEPALSEYGCANCSRECIDCCGCGQVDPMPFAHDDGCAVWENRHEDWGV